MNAPREQVSDVKKASFWVSQIFIIIATVAGVFLAASQGLKQALQFDNIKSEQTNYYLRKSLSSELADNVGYMREYIEKVNNRIQKPVLDLETFVWNSMMYSPNALETPSELLREAQKFYHRANDIMNTPHFNEQAKAKNLGELAEHIEKNVLPRFQADTEAIRKSLAAKNISL